jgi:hypothetical protein
MPTKQTRRRYVIVIGNDDYGWEYLARPHIQQVGVQLLGPNWTRSLEDAHHYTTKAQAQGEAAWLHRERGYDTLIDVVNLPTT